ncbi:MAG: hypothetical protein HQK54_01985 [Oligoflexales bacterium]|nr:hypothetical protein [Oligoflexales bacterium]
MNKHHYGSSLVAIIFLFSALGAYAFENAQVLPKGVRNLTLRNVSTETNQKSDLHGDRVPLAIPLMKPLKFSDILKNEDGVKKTQLAAFLSAKGFSDNESVGDFKADLAAKINVTAPIFAYGISENLTIALAAPVYSASTDVKVGFTPNQNADKFVGLLASKDTNNTKSAIEAAGKITDAVQRLNNKLRDNGYSELTPWHGTALGDMQLVSKYGIYKKKVVNMASAVGVIAPTGKVDNPDILTDLPTGNGVWGGTFGLYVDERIAEQAFFNQYAKYTYQSPGSKVVRLKTESEAIEVEKKALNFKPGDGVEGGISFQIEQQSGIVFGLGSIYTKKFGDRYKTTDPEVKSELQKETDQSALYGQARIGYSTIGAYKRREMAAPASATIEYRKQYAGKNIPLTDFTQIDVNIYF